MRAGSGTSVRWESASGGDRRVEHRPGAGALSRAEAQRDTTVRKWGVVSPSATVIGRAESPEADLSESVRRLHDERHTATEGHSRRAHYLDRLRTTQALCNAVDVTPWQRDVALGVMGEIDLTEFGSQRAIEKVALVVIRHVVDVDRRRYFGLDDLDAGSVSSERLEDLFEQYKRHDVTEEPAFQRLADRYDLDKTSLNRLRRVLTDQLAGGLPAFGRNPERDPHLPAFTDRDVPGAEADAG
ncbi:DNA-directed RNA polymerase epsilon subunit [Halobacterium sp. DL1]|nr:DNA-directed RNA polymerase epsilon subunit [Halobacterium sp. DL1]